MAKKAANPTPTFFEDVAAPAPVRPLPPRAQALFLPKLVDEAVKNLHIEAYAERRAAAHEAFKGWVKNLRSGQLLKLNESQLEQDFTTGLLGSLGYQTQGQALPGQPWSAQPKWSFPGAGIADAVLGQFESGAENSLTGHVTVIVELKGPKADLDKLDPATKRTPVQQAWGYMNACQEAQWALVSNYVEFRLYAKRKTLNDVHRVLLDDLDNPEAFARFFAVFHADSLLSDRRLTHRAEELLRMTEEKQDKVGKQLYQTYNDQRLRLIEVLRTRQGVTDLDTAIRTAQKLLDRVLFIAFAEDRRLIDDGRILEKMSQPQVPMLSTWNNFQNLFRAFNRGHRPSGISEFDGSLFAADPILDAPDFELDDSWPNLFQQIGDYDFKDEVSVEVLGHIFEQSITDLEKLRALGYDAYRAERESRKGNATGERKRQGVFYTNRATVNYLVGAALDPAWEERLGALAENPAHWGSGPSPLPPGEGGRRPGEGESGTAQAPGSLFLTRPLRGHPLPGGEGGNPSGGQAALIRAQLAALDGLTVCDPACGSGAFLIAAYQWFDEKRTGLLDALAVVEPDAPECAGRREDWRARSADQILRHNIYGVDLAGEAIEIARLSLWIETARKDRKLTDLTGNVVEGNSVVDDSKFDPRAFDWQARFPDVFARGGFDAVIGNPPYVRQEYLGPIKPHLAARFQAYHGMADLYVYFYERGVQILKPGGRLAFVVTNKWMKAGYGEPLRRYFAEHAWVEQVIDFGHAKQFFPDADVFPCFLVVRKPTDGPKPEDARVCVIPREMVKLEELPAQVARFGLVIEQERLGGGSWNLEPKAVNELLAKIRDRGTPLAEFAAAKPYRGILTGYNNAFLIDSDTRNALIQSDPKSKALIRPYLRGQDIERWHPDWAGLWMIALKSSGDHPWPWADQGENAEACFAATFPALHKHLKQFEAALIARQDKGRYWWELRSCAYWDEFDRPKFMYQEIQFHPSYCFDCKGLLGNNKTFFIKNGNIFLIGLLNSPLMWWFNWRYLPHMKDEALTPVSFLLENLPVLLPSDSLRSEMNDKVEGLIGISQTRSSTRTEILDWLKMQFEITDPGMKLRDPVGLTSDSFVAEVLKARGKSKAVSAAGQKLLREEYARTIEPARARAVEALALERRVSDLVNEAYGLTPEEVRLMWDTAPPRMPIPRPEMM